MPMIGGKVTDSNGNGVARTLRAYRRDTGELLWETISNASTGAYSVEHQYTGEVQVIMLDDASGALENDQILRTVPV